MSTGTVALDRRVAHWWARRGDYVELTKPKISLMVLVTVAVAAYAARWGQPDGWLVLHTLLGTWWVSASASAWNQWLEVETDARMDRTSNRPLPARRLSAWQVGLFGTLTGLIGAGYLAWAVNPITAGLAVATWVCYVVLYTPLKTRSSWNTAVGAVSGALPMLIGWTAVGGSLNPLVDPRGWGLFLILFVWQFPHFMAIAWIYREQYGQAGLKMTSVVEPTGRSAGWLAVAMGVLLIPISLLPLWGWGSSGAETVGWGPSLYLAAALLLGTGQAICSVGFLLRRDQANARRLLRASLIYLPLLMAFLVFLPWV